MLSHKAVGQLGRRCITYFRLTMSLGRKALRIPNPKIFVIGRNKTGTTSMKAALAGLGYSVGNQRAAELLMEDWARRDFRRIIRYCHTSDAFQDVPFSHHYTFQAVDAAFPGSKFILTIRDTTDDWYHSVLRFNSKLLEKRVGSLRLPTVDDLRNDPYVYPGWRWRSRELVGFGNLSEAFPEKEMKDHYDRHNELVIDYFRHRPDDLLILNVGSPDAMQKLCRFLGHQWSGQLMPQLNASK